MNPPTLYQLPDGRLALKTESGSEAVEVSQCFPWSAPKAFLSLKNKAGEELLFIKSLSQLEPESRELLASELEKSRGTFLIDSIQSLSKEIELRCWEVTTKQGARSFQTELDEWPQQLPDGTFLVEDLFGDLYVVPKLENLNPATQKLFWPLIG